MVYAQLAVGQRPELEPVDTGARSAAIGFLLPPRAGVISAVVADLGATPDVVDSAFKTGGHRAGEPTSNNTYLGHAMVVDRAGLGARRKVEDLLGGVAVRYADEAAPVA
jgi:argininosuccinate lyase